MKRTSLTLQHVKTEAIKFAIMLLGTFILAFAYYHINFQNHLSEGGFVGLALLGKAQQAYHLLSVCCYWTFRS